MTDAQYKECTTALKNLAEAALTKAEEQIDIPEKRALDGAVESDNKRARTGVAA
jgi:hypothetical protein